MKPASLIAVFTLTASIQLLPITGRDALAQQHSADDVLESRIETTLKKDSVLAPRDIDVEAERGVVTLTGAVRTATEKERAGRLARVDGVTSVVNEIEIDPNIDRSKADVAGEKTKAGLNKAVDATVRAGKRAKEGVQKGVGESAKGVGKAAEKTAEAVGTAGEKVTDASLTTSVRNRFADEPLLKDTAIEVHTANRIVTLKGTVGSEAAKARAGEIAAKTSGVARVVNELTIDGR